MKERPHLSVMQEEVVAAFDGMQIHTFFDGTVGAGGHALAILEAHPEIKCYLACDRDPKAHEWAKKLLKPWQEKVDWIQGSFSDLSHFLRDKKISSIDGFLVDAGVSSMQLDQGERGFSFRFEGPLDMRMDPSHPLTAKEIVNRYSEKELERIFREYGEERQSKKAAEAIVKARKKKPIGTTMDLVRVLEPVLRKGALHPATLIFQALRIVVNDELGELLRGIEAAVTHLAPGGRMAFISFHSLEDRIVKHQIKGLEFRAAKKSKPESGCLKILTKKPLVPTRKECLANPRSRSAKLRIAEKIGDR